MTVSMVMTTGVVVVAPTAPVRVAITKLVRDQHLTLPVVDEKGRYIGVFGVAELAKLLLPKGAIQGQGRIDLSFLGTDTGQLKEHLQQIAERPVQGFMRVDLPTLTPEDPLVEALSLCLHEHCSIPVVDPVDKKLLGIVAYWDVLKTVTGTDE